MNKGIAHILMNSLLDMPFIQKFGGLVAVQEQPDRLIDEESQTDKSILKTFPVTDDFVITKGDYTGFEGLMDFIPNSDFWGMLYFEDYGIDPLGREGKVWKYRSKLRLVAWLDTKRIVSMDDFAHLSGYSLSTALLSAIQEKFSLLDNTRSGYYQRIRPRERAIVPQDKNIFSKYNYDQNANQYIMPGFEFFAIDYDVEFRINPSCITKLGGQDIEQTAIIWDEDNKQSYLVIGDCDVLAYQNTVNA